MRNKKYSAMITHADNSNSFSWFVISYFITVKHKQGSKKLFLAVPKIRRRGNKFDISCTLGLTILEALIEIFEEAISRI